MAKLKYFRSILFVLLLVALFQLVAFLAFHYINISPSGNFFWDIASGIQTASLVALLLAFIAAIIQNSMKKYEIPLVLMLSGGISNLFEKIIYKGVVDYIPLFFYSIKSNLADLALTLGVILFTIISLRSEPRPVNEK